jgi:hypothetical protein
MLWEWSPARSSRPGSIIRARTVGE